MNCSVGQVRDPQTGKCIVPRPADSLNQNADHSISRYVIFIIAALVIVRAMRQE